MSTPGRIEGEALQAIIDEERGYLDREHRQGCGWSGPVTPAYLRGYGEDADMRQRSRATHEFNACYVEHGWY